MIPLRIISKTLRTILKIVNIGKCHHLLINKEIKQTPWKWIESVTIHEILTFKDMLSKYHDSTIQVENIQKLMIKFKKYFCSLSVPTLKDVFTKRALKYFVNNKNYNTATTVLEAAQVWSTLPSWQKNFPSLGLFRSEMIYLHCTDFPWYTSQILLILLVIQIDISG